MAAMHDTVQIHTVTIKYKYKLDNNNIKISLKVHRVYSLNERDCVCHAADLAVSAVPRRTPHVPADSVSMSLETTACPAAFLPEYSRDSTCPHPSYTCTQLHKQDCCKTETVQKWRRGAWRPRLKTKTWEQQPGMWWSQLTSASVGFRFCISNLSNSHLSHDHSLFH